MTAIATTLPFSGRLALSGAEGQDARDVAAQIRDREQSLSAAMSVLPPSARLGTELLEAFAEASVEDWDGHGASPASLDHLRSAARFLDRLPPTWPLPGISVDPDGEFDFEWREGRDRVFSVSLGADGTLAYAGLYGRSRVHGVEQLDSDFVQTLREN